MEINEFTSHMEAIPAFYKETSGGGNYLQDTQITATESPPPRKGDEHTAHDMQVQVLFTFKDSVIGFANEEKQNLGQLIQAYKTGQIAEVKSLAAKLEQEASDKVEDIIHDYCSSMKFIGDAFPFDRVEILNGVNEATKYLNNTLLTDIGSYVDQLVKTMGSGVTEEPRNSSSEEDDFFVLPKSLDVDAIIDFVGEELAPLLLVL